MKIELARVSQPSQMFETETENGNKVLVMNINATDVSNADCVQIAIHYENGWLYDIDDLEIKLKKIGLFYRNNTNAFCFRLKKDVKKLNAIFWQKGETYREFLERCEKLKIN